MKKALFIILLLSKITSRYFSRLKDTLLFNSGRSLSGLTAAGKEQKNVMFPHAAVKIGLTAFVLIVAGVFLWRTTIKFKESTLSEGIVGLYDRDNLNPAALPAPVTRLISRPLVSLDKSGLPQPDLVSGWDEDNNATTYIFHLKDNLYWNDGSKVLSSDIKFNIPDVTISYPDEKTIAFKLPEPFAPLPTFLTTPVFKNGGWVGVGDYRVSGMAYSNGFLAKLNLAPKAVGKTALPNLVIRFYQDEPTLKTAFTLGEVSTMLGLSDDEGVKSAGNTKESQFTDFNRVLAVFYNTKDDTLKDKNLRKALTAAMPSFPGAQQAKGPIPSFSWAFSEPPLELNNNLNLAKSYLDKAGGGKDTKVVLMTTSDFQSAGGQIVNSWKNLGLQATLKIESGMPQSFQALLVAEPIPADPDQYTLWHSTQTQTNLSKYSGPRVDKDLEDGRKTKDIKQRKESYADFQKTLSEDCPAAFLYYPKTLTVYRSNVESDLQKVLPLQLPAS